MTDPYARLWSLANGTTAGNLGARSGIVAPVQSAVAATSARNRGGQGGVRAPQVGPDMTRVAAAPKSRHTASSSKPSKPGSAIKRNTPTVSRRVAQKISKFAGDLGAIEASLADLRKTRLLAQRGYISADDVNVLAVNRAGGLPRPNSRMPLTAGEAPGQTPAAIASAPELVGYTPDTAQPPPTNAVLQAPSRSGGRGAVGASDLNQDYATAAAGTTGKTVQRQMAAGGAQGMPTPAEQQAPPPPPKPRRSVLFSRMDD